MIAVFQNFKNTIFNPFGEKTNEERLGYFEILGISWALHFIYAFYSVFAVFVGVKTFQYASNTNSISQIIYGNFSLWTQKFVIIFGISEAIMYPVVFHFSYKFWLFLLGFYSQIFKTEIDVEEQSVDILNAIYASNVFLILPVGGKVLSFFAQGFYLFKGLMQKFGFSNLQAFLVLLTPLFIMFLFAILIVSYFIFLLSLI
jgi:hypothetical protein